MSQPSAPIYSPSDEALDRAAAALQAGQLVAFPTETVYGLGADARNDTAVARIYEAKGRPSFNPLIVHFPSSDAAAAHVTLDSRAQALAQAFWPGPLTLVLPRRAESPLSRLVSAGLPSVAVRVPSHPLAQALLQRAAVPVAAPSANRSGAISPTLAQHVAASLGNRVAMILDGGACAVGLESTVVDLSTPTAALLRPGGITREEIEAVIGPLVLSTEAEDAPKSPGQLLSHYAPGLPVRLNATEAVPGEALLGFAAIPGQPLSLSARGDLVEAAAGLFAALHQLDDPTRYRAIAVAPIPEQGLGLAINDRLRRAAAPRDGST
jgi:L-threonylcarbamoyladenylate synthase